MQITITQLNKLGDLLRSKISYLCFYRGGTPTSIQAKPPKTGKKRAFKKTLLCSYIQVSTLNLILIKKIFTLKESREERPYM